MIHTKAPMLAVFLGLTASAHAALPKHAAILPEAVAPELLKQCSRPSINGAESYWGPSSKQVWALEGKLAGYFARAKLRSGKSETKLSEYYRQYVGVVAGGRKLIYGNLFRRSDYDHVPSARTEKDPDYWRKEPVVACDGGNSYWGVVYDVEKAVLEPPVHNGWIGD